MTIPITKLRGVGLRIADQLARLHLHTVEDLLFHLPLRYEDRTRITPIIESMVGQNVLIEGKIQSIEKRAGGKPSLVCMLGDESGVIALRFFHFTAGQLKQLQPATQLRCFGEVRQGYHCLELVHPEYKILTEATPPPTQMHLTAVYPATQNISQKLLRNLVAQALQLPIKEYLPESLIKQFNLLTLQQALTIVHHVPIESNIQQLEAKQHPAQRRLAFEELLAQHLSLRILRHQTETHQAPILKADNQLIPPFLAALPFQLTQAQQRVSEEIQQDLIKPKPMQRLVQGDVGSGKTVVAALAMLHAVEAGYQVAIMAPTELLAEQHLHTFQQWLAPLKINITWLTGSLTPKQRELALNETSQGHTQVIIGTHALFQEAVTFFQLGLVIIDEQHRFGVHQRLALRDKGNHNGQYPHQLIMTATPIPRTLAMTAYADLDVSIIDELPPHRQPVNTAVIPNTRRDDIIARIHIVCTQGRQAYWVCPLIEESDSLQLQAAEETAIYLKEVLPTLNIGLVHGRMKARDKEAVMMAFKNHELDLLVATTVIEVGVDVPNASLMIIENAERLGLAQLHQLRGRVGRGHVDSHCVLLYQVPLTQIAKIRLGVMRESNDGFYIAQQDLELRGPGEVLGTKQTGLMHLRVADLQRDQDLLDNIHQAAQLVVQDCPDCIHLLMQRWIKEGVKYGAV